MDAMLTEDDLSTAVAGSGPAAEKIYRSLAPQVLGYLRTKGLEDPEGTTQDVFLTVFRMLETASAPVIVLAENGEESMGALAMTRGVRACLVKDQLSREALHQAVALALEDEAPGRRTAAERAAPRMDGPSTGR